VVAFWLDVCSRGANGAFMKKLHHWSWRSGHYLLTCGRRDGLIDRRVRTVNCKDCLKVTNLRGWKIVQGEKIVH